MRRLGALIGRLCSLYGRCRRCRRFSVGTICSVALVLATGCIYSFAGGGLPPHIHTMSIGTFDNQTASPDLPKELYDQFHRELQRRLGVRDAPSDRADALVKG